VRPLPLASAGLAVECRLGAFPEVDEPIVEKAEHKAGEIDGDHRMSAMVAHQECEDGPVILTGTMSPPPISTGSRGPGSLFHIQTKIAAMAIAPQTSAGTRRPADGFERPRRCTRASEAAERIDIVGLAPCGREDKPSGCDHFGSAQEDANSKSDGSYQAHDYGLRDQDFWHRSAITTCADLRPR
jgi:hypothetical protein